MLVYLVSDNETVSTKFEIISLVNQDIHTWTLKNYFLGKGGNVTLANRSLHLLFLQIIYYTGFLGIIVFSLIVVCLVRFHVRYTLVAFGLLGLSFVPFSSPLITIVFFLESSIFKNKMGSL